MIRSVIQESTHFPLSSADRHFPILAKPVPQGPTHQAGSGGFVHCGTVLDHALRAFPSGFACGAGHHSPGLPRSVTGHRLLPHRSSGSRLGAASSGKLTHRLPVVDTFSPALFMGSQLVLK